MIRRLAMLSVLLATICAPAAQASTEQLSIMMDDDLLLYRDNVTQTRTLVTMRAMGVDYVRATVLWKTVAENASPRLKDIRELKGKKAKEKARKQRKRFRASNPRTYPTRNWDRYDNLVKEAQELGMRVYFTITGPGPWYAHKKAPKSQRRNAGTYKPYRTRYRSFVQAVGKRYSGNYRDENGIRKKLPRVALWSLWNEPNQAGWLSPQWEKVDGETVPAAPAMYRELHIAGVQGLERSGHGDDAIFLGETAPLGSTQRGPRNSLRPVPFLRELLCIQPDGTPYTGKDASRRDCHDFNRVSALKATAYAHHPYTKKDAPTKAPRSPDDVTMANIGNLGPVLDRLAVQSGGRIPGALPIFLTEFGYESNPPDPRNGIPYFKQADYIQLADFLAYNEPRIKATTQFLLRDAAPQRRYKKGSRLYWFTYQSGLYTVKGRAKPAAFAYTMPFIVYPAGPGQVGFWGQLRFRPNSSQDVAVVMWRPNDKVAWTQVGAPTPTTFRNFYGGTLTAPGPGGEYRAVYVDPKTAKIAASSLTAEL